MLTIGFFMALAVAQATQPAPATTPSAAPKTIDAENLPRLQTAAQLLRDHQPQEALDVLAVAIASYENSFTGESRRRYCGMSSTETLAYMLMAAKDKVDAIAVSPAYCEALYMKGYALVDLGRRAEAGAAYGRVIALAPEHAPYLTELGQLIRLDKDWPRMLTTCEHAASAAGLSPPPLRARQQGAALRCQGYALVEEHRLDDAEKRYKEALALDPHDLKAQGELTYIANQRAKKP